MIVTLIDVQDDIPIGLWAHEHCPSFTGWVVVDNSPIALCVDYRFYFDNEQDAVIFQLRWQGQNSADL